MLVVVGTLLSLAFSASQGGRADNELDGTLTTTISATLSFTFTSTHVVTLPTISSFTTTSSTSKPTYTATEIYAVRPGTPFHMMPFQAAGGVFRLGGGNAAYCPLYAEKLGACEARTNITGINGCSLVSPRTSSLLVDRPGSSRLHCCSFIMHAKKKAILTMVSQLWFLAVNQSISHQTASSSTHHLTRHIWSPAQSPAL